jgi:hypothetical protein
MALPCYLSDSALSYEKLQSYKTSSIQKDWFGGKADVPRTFVLACDPQSIWFYAYCKEAANYDAKFKLGHFAEGLWNFDVAEIFICDDTTKAYQEFNLSPNGAWWTSAFSDYRARTETLLYQTEGPSCFSTIEPDFWKACIRVPRSFLSLKASFTEKTRANISFVQSKPEIRYFSWAKIPSEKPDFHKSQGYEHLEMK